MAKRAPTRTKAKATAKKQAISRSIDEQLKLVSIESVRAGQRLSRGIDPVHVNSLMRDMLQQGMLQPLVVDRNLVLLAGGHRLEAVNRMRKQYCEQFQERFPNGLIPVWVHPVDISDKAARWRIELAENEFRKDYSDSELDQIILGLEKDGYSTARGGRSKKGEQHITKAIAQLLNKSERQARRRVNRILREREGKPVKKGGLQDRIVGRLLRDIPALQELLCRSDDEDSSLFKAMKQLESGAALLRKALGKQSRKKGTEEEAASNRAIAV